MYELPATQLNYIMRKAPDQGNANQPEFVGAPTLDKVTMQWETATYFKLNTHEPVVRRFFEEICLQYRCTDLSLGGGWDRMVADTVRQQVVATIQAESRRYTSDDIYANRDTLLSIQQEIGSTLKDRLVSVLGGEFFCGPGYHPAHPLDCPGFTFLIKEVTVPPNVADQYNANRASALAVEQSRHQATQRRVEAEGEAARQAALREAPELHTLEIRMDKANHASAAVPPKAGYTLTGEEATREQLAPGHTGHGWIWTLERAAWSTRQP